MIFDKDEFVHPLQDANILDGYWAMLKNFGLRYRGKGVRIQNVNRIIPKSKKVIFILVDAMGSHLLSDLLPNSFMENHKKMDLNTVYPTSTGTVLTSLATGRFPSEHGINGWYSYLYDHNLSLVTLKYLNRFTLEAINSEIFSEVFYKESIYNSIPFNYCTITNKKYVDSIYSTYSRGNKKGYGYNSIENAFSRVKSILKNGKEDLIHLYIDTFDSVAHEYGVKSNEAKSILERINSEVIDLYREMDKNTSIIIIADHGQIDVKKEDFFSILPDDKLNRYFIGPPGGDARFTSFYIKEDSKVLFKNEFIDRYGDFCEFMSIDEFDELGIVGPNNMSSVTKERFGNFVAIWKRGYAFEYIQSKSQIKMKGLHGGLTKEEVVIPFIVIDRE